ncbi:hypothetical protein WJX81_006525 [Elliptochloris bilobata]|uniref:Uncharacterized protein n=1 Tax=Elliptochloris bilobata TaxID=381761 RepID=A0AAW1SJ10_9CHLO
MASAASNNVVSLQAQVEHLKSEVLRLQKKLGDAHVSDVGALRRAHATLSQHSQALHIEAQGISERISTLDTEVVRPDEVGAELGVLGTVVAAAYTVNHLLRLAPLREAARLGRAVWLAGAAYEVYRLANGVLRRLAAFTVHNARRKQQLLDEWRILQARIDMMADLAAWAPPQAIAAAAAAVPKGAASPASPAAREAQASAHAQHGRAADALAPWGPAAGPSDGSEHSRAAAAAAMMDNEAAALHRRLAPQGPQL